MVGGKNMSGEPLLILLVEDEAAHAELIMRSFEDHQMAYLIRHVVDGEAALDYLFRRGAYADPETSPRPHVILLDLRLPRVDGLEVLKEIRESEALRNIPVIVLTTSDSEQDVAKAYEHHANSYVLKPVDYDKFAALMSDLDIDWLVGNYDPWSSDAS